MNYGRPHIDSIPGMHAKLKFYHEEQTQMSHKIVSYKQRTAQAQSDKLELMRDLATYENNFSCEVDLRRKLMLAHDRI